MSAAVKGDGSTKKLILFLSIFYNAAMRKLCKRQKLQQMEKCHLIYGASIYSVNGGRFFVISKFF